MTLTPCDFLLVDDDDAFASVLARVLSRRGYSTKIAANAATALRLTEQCQFARAIVDLNLGRDSGLMLIRELKMRQADIKIVMLTGYSSISTAVDAIKLGAANYLCKPAEAEDILAAFDADDDWVAHDPANLTPMSVDRLEWEHIQKVLQQHSGNISATARSLGMHRRTLQRKLQKRPVKQ